MNKKKVRISVLLALISSCVFAQEKEIIASQQELDEVVVSDSKFALAKEKSGKVITNITAKELLNRPGQSVATILNTVAGIEINGNQSAAGKNLGYYIRGGKNSQVLILIDGIPVNDASGISMEYDLRLLPVEQVESIEIMKGAASTLYGSGAATGLINIKLKKSGKKSLSGNAYFNVGTNATATQQNQKAADFNQGFSINGRTTKLSYFTALNSTETNGISQIAPPNPNVNYEEDPFSRLNYMSKVGYSVSDKMTLDFFGNYDQIKNDYDGGFDNTGTSDTNLNKTSSKQFRFGFSPKFKYNKGEFIINSSLNKLVRSYDELDTYSNSVGFSQYESRSVNVDGFNKYQISDSFYLVSGLQYQFHDANSVTPYGNITKENTKFNMIDPYVTGVYTSSLGFNLNVGARWNSHSAYGNQLVYNVNPSFDFQTLPFKIISSYSTAFVTPSLYQLYSPYGNSSLTPEKNSTAELGIETQLGNNNIRWNLVGFYREQTNFIGFYFNPVTDASNYVNINGLNKAKGIETEIQFVLSNQLKWNSNYTFTQVDEALDRLIPKHKFNSSLDYKVSDRLFWNVSYQYIDARKDAFFDGNTYATTPVNLGSYQLVNTLARYEIIKNRCSVFGSAQNIFNADFIENLGYSTLGRNFKFGITLNW